jgi:phosphopantetheinyl transferase (holo-ACP synthase)
VSGNDIVDIATAAAESNWERVGFLEKIFTQQEQQYILDAAMPGQMVWRLWTMKESAYKIYTRQHGGRFFAPQKLSCILLSETYGEVSIYNDTYQTITSATKDYIYTIATLKDDKSDPLNFCFAIPADAGQQKFIYEKLIAGYASIKGQDKSNFTILKNKDSIPFLYCKNEKRKIPVSITHHGNYAAYTFNLPHHQSS